MSGICGILHWDGRPADRAGLERQLASLAHRGPDRRRAWSAGPMALGHLLLRVTPEDAADAQPLAGARSGIIVTADLRLDNRADLAAALALPAREAAMLPDSALLLAAYERWDADCVEHLLGDFAFAIWDPGRRRLMLASDHMGQRALFYHRGQGFLAFASEIKGLWALPEVPRRLDESWIGGYLARAGTGGAPRTPFAGIRALPRATVLTVTASGESAERRYWWPQPAPDMLGRREADYVAAYRAVLGEAVACRLRSVRPPALCLSGGFDSAGIAALAGPVLAARGGRLIAVSSVAADGAAGRQDDARPWVERCRRHMPHLEVHYVTPQGGPMEGWERGFLEKDRLAGPDYAAERALLDRAAAAGARVVLHGLGGDYTLNPPGRYFLADLLRRGRLWRFLHELAAFCRVTGRGPWRALREEVVVPLAPALLIALYRDLRYRGGVERWGRQLPIAPALAQRLGLRGAARAARARDLDRRDWRRPAGHRALLELTAGAGCTLLAAARGLDLTQPFHDKRVIELALAIPVELDVRDGWNRHLARTALKDLYPPDYATRDWRRDRLDPDEDRRLSAGLGEIRCELDRMSEAGIAAAYVDLAQIRSWLDEWPDGPRARLKAAGALAGLQTARFIEWFEGANRATAPRISIRESE